MKILLTLNLLLFFFLSSIQTQAFAENRTTYYAKITSNNVFFYQTLDENAKLFEIPNSYFVLLTDNANDDFYAAKYGEMLGFVKKSEVVPMDGTPQNPYATNYSCRITSMSGLSLKSEPTFESETIENLEFLENKIYFYGKKQGQEFFPNSTDVWLYCKYSLNDTTKFGYVFSYYCDFSSNVKENKEYFNEITESLTFSQARLNNNGLTESIKAIIVLSVIIPCLIVTFTILTKGKNKQTKRAYRKKDYYELNENDLN